jgi:two-component system sensor histidine kinase YesM
MRLNYHWNRSYGLKRKATTIFLLLVISLTLGVGAVIEYQFNRILREQFVDTMTRNLDSVVSQLKEQTSMVEDISNYLIFSPDLNEYLRSSISASTERAEALKATVEGLLTFHLISKSYIRSISINGFNGRSINMGEPVSADEDKWLEEAVRRKGGIVWSEGYVGRSGWDGDIRVVSLIRILNSYRQGMLPQASLVIRLDEVQIIKLLENALYKEAGHVFVIGPGGDIVLGSEETLQMAGSLKPEKVLETMKMKNTSYINYKSDKTNYLTFHIPMENTDWDIVTMIPESIVDGRTRVVWQIMAVILIVILLIGLATLMSFHYTIIRPILRLKNETNRVKRGDFTAHLPIESNDEISDLNRNFNEMVLTIRELIDHKYKLELRERESELKLLQNQMDPHFLYNTLDMIRWTARLEKAQKTSNLIEVMSRFFRSSLNKGHYVTTIQQELEFVQSYLYLQEKRLGKRFRYSLYTEYHIAESLTLKATIHPLVENFVKHGLNKNIPVNIIAVKCYEVANEIWIDVQDNGKGMGADKLDLIRASLQSKWADDERVGALRNIHERLSIYFGAGYGLVVLSSTDEGTLVRMKIPYSESNGGAQHDENG